MAASGPDEYQARGGAKRRISRGVVDNHGSTEQTCRARSVPTRRVYRLSSLLHAIAYWLDWPHGRTASQSTI
jgi:hypothetical protein